MSYQKMMSVKAVADVLQVTQRSIYNYLEDGKLDGVKTPGGQWRILESSLDKYLSGAKFDPYKLVEPRKYPRPIYQY